MVKSKSILYILNYTSRKISSKIYDSIEDLPEIPDTLVDYATRIINIYTNFDRNDLPRIKNNIASEVGKNIKHKNENGRVMSVGVYFIVDDFTDKKSLIYFNNEFLNLVGENFHWVTINVDSKKYDFSTLLAYNKRYIEKAYSNVTTSNPNNLEEGKFNNLEENDISLVKYFSNSLKVINSKKFISNDLLYKERHCPKNVKNNLLLKKLYFNLVELEYYEKYTTFVAEYYNLREKYVKTGDQRIYDLLEKQNVLIDKMKKEIYYSKHDAVYSKDNQTCIINTTNKFIEVSKTLGIVSYSTEKKINSNVVLINDNIYFISTNLKKALAVKKLNSNSINLVFSNVEWIESDNNSKILLFANEKYNQNELLLYLYDTETNDIKQIKIKNKLIRNYVSSGKNGKRLEVYNARISSNNKIQNRYFVEFDKVNNQWIILNYLGSSNNLDKYRLLIISNDGKCIMEKNIVIDKVYFTGNTKFLYFNEKLYIPREGYISEYMISDNEIVERKMKNCLVTINSKLEVSDNNTILLFEGKGIYRVNEEKFK